MLLWFWRFGEILVKTGHRSPAEAPPGGDFIAPETHAKSEMPFLMRDPGAILFLERCHIAARRRKLQAAQAAGRRYSR